VRHTTDSDTLYTSGIQPGVREDTLRFSFLSFKTYYLIGYIILDVIYFIYFRCRLYNMYNLHYVPTALGVQS
jgi:hypothetical protein